MQLLLIACAQWLCERLFRNSKQRSFCSSRQLYFLEPRTKMTTYDDSSFQAAGPRECNKLPLDIRESITLRNFKHKLKAFLLNVITMSELLILVIHQSIIFVCLCKVCWTLWISYSEQIYYYYFFLLCYDRRLLCELASVTLIGLFWHKQNNVTHHVH